MIVKTIEKSFIKTKPNDLKVGMLSFQYIDSWTGRVESVDISLNPTYEGGIYFLNQNIFIKFILFMILMNIE